MELTLPTSLAETIVLAQLALDTILINTYRI